MMMMMVMMVLQVSELVREKRVAASNRFHIYFELVCLFGFDCLVLANCFVGFFFSFLLSCTFVHCFVLLRL